MFRGVSVKSRCLTGKSVKKASGASAAEYNIDDITGTELTTDAVIIYDDGGPDGDYGGGANYYVDFTAPAGKTVSFTITDCEIENYGWVEGLFIYHAHSDDMSNMVEHIKGRASINEAFWADKNTPYTISSGSQQARLKFTSDTSIEYAGFRVEVAFL